MVPVKRCYRHSGMLDTFIELLSIYEGSKTYTIKVRWWNVNEYEGQKPYQIHFRPSKYKIKKSKWKQEFKRINWVKECGV